MSKKKKIVLIIIAVILFLLLLSIITYFAMEARDGKNNENSASTQKEALTITCVKEVGHDEVQETEVVYIEKGVLISKRTSAIWNKTEPKEKTCEYYTDQTNGLVTKRGVTATVDCDESRGTATATYVIAEMDREDMKIKQFDYLTKDDIFDYQGWENYMTNNGYVCEEE